MSYNRNYYLKIEVEHIILCTAIFGEDYHQHVLCFMLIRDYLNEF